MNGFPVPSGSAPLPDLADPFNGDIRDVLSNAAHGRGARAASGTSRPSISHRIAAALRDAIVAGTLEPGARLRQDAIARHFSVSAIPVREALRQLESEGWITVELNKGAAVTALSASEAREIYEIRSALESLAIGLAIPRQTPAWLEQCASLCVAAASESDSSRYVERNEAFHLSLYAAAGRPKLLDLIRDLHRRGERYLRLKFGLPSFKGQSDAEHAALLDAVRARDVPLAQRLVTEHLLCTGEMLYQFLTERAASEAARTPVASRRAKRGAG
jgi:DNA-binding GntR family transcriptional regulator